MVKLTQLGKQDKADGERGKTGGLRRQPKFGGGVQEQEGNGDVFIDDIGDELGLSDGILSGLPRPKEY